MYQILEYDPIKTFDVSNENLKFRDEVLTDKYNTYPYGYGQYTLNKEHPNFSNQLSSDITFKSIKQYRNMLIDCLAYADKDVIAKNIEHAQNEDAFSKLVNSLQLGYIRKLYVGDFTFEDIALHACCNDIENLYWKYYCVESWLSCLYQKTHMHKFIFDLMQEIGDIDKITIYDTSGNKKATNLSELIEWELNSIHANMQTILSEFIDALQYELDVVREFDPF